MSALPPIATLIASFRHVRLGPTVNVVAYSIKTVGDHLAQFFLGLCRQYANGCAEMVGRSTAASVGIACSEIRPGRRTKVRSGECPRGAGPSHHSAATTIPA